VSAGCPAEKKKNNVDLGWAHKNKDGKNVFEYFEVISVWLFILIE